MATEEKTKVKLGRRRGSVPRAIALGSLEADDPFCREGVVREGLALAEGEDVPVELKVNAGLSPNCFSSIVTLRDSRPDLNSSSVAFAGETSMSVASESASAVLFADEPKMGPPNASCANTTSCGSTAVIHEGVTSIAAGSADVFFVLVGFEVGVVEAGAAAGELDEKGDGVEGVWELWGVDLLDPFGRLFCFFDAGVGL